tara:strand:- start:3139 stop:4185 length:1047 start_codon:yes stop_codon:yes gene_type:complete
MRLLITGGCGFIGSNYIINHLKSSDKIQILNIDKLTYAGNIDNLKHIENTNYQFIQCDITDIEKLSKIFNQFKPDAIIHFAAESHVDRSIDSPIEFVKTNSLGTSILLDIATKYWKTRQNSQFKFLHISTDEVFGSLSDDGFFTEQTPYSPNSPYSASKAGADFLVRAWNRTYNLPTIIINASNNYGPYQFPEKLIPLMIANCIDEKPLPIYGEGQNIRDWLYVEDHCDAINCVLNKGKEGETYNVGGNNEINNIDIVNIICSILDKKIPRKNGSSYKKLITHVIDRPAHDYRYAIDSSKIKKTLGWTPKTKFEKGIEDTINWYIGNENWWRKIQNRSYNQERLGLIN